MSKYTRGPWKVVPGESAPRVCVDGDREWPIVVTVSGHNAEGIQANERLIAAAPELLKALEWAISTDELPRGKEFDKALFAVMAAKGILDDEKE